MGDNSKIEWTDATWNFLLGCFYKSIGCTNCYAVWTCWRLSHNPNPKIAAAYAGLVRKTGDGKLVWTGKVNFVEERLTLPLRWKRPRKIFVNSQSDLFHEDVPFDVIDRAFAVMALCPQHVFQILTKRPDRMREYVEGAGIVGGLHGRSWRVREAGHAMNVPIGDDVNFAFPLPNVWLGTSVENQKAADERIPDLLATPAAVRFLSCEPLLGTVNLDPHWLGSDGRSGDNYQQPQIHWVIVGGESGPNARPMHPDWARSLRDQCVAAGVPFFFKQWGEYLHERVIQAALEAGEEEGLLRLFQHPHINVANENFFRVGKREAGRGLDGLDWSQYPA